MTRGDPDYEAPGQCVACSNRDTRDERIAALEAEVARLRTWKASAQAVEREWDAQAIATMLGARPGQSCRAAIAERVPQIVGCLKFYAEFAGTTDARIAALTSRLAESESALSAEREKNATLATVSRSMIEGRERDLAAANKQIIELEKELREERERTEKAEHDLETKELAVQEKTCVECQREAEIENRILESKLAAAIARTEKAEADADRASQIIADMNSEHGIANELRAHLLAVEKAESERDAALARVRELEEERDGRNLMYQEAVKIADERGVAVAAAREEAVRGFAEWLRENEFGSEWDAEFNAAHYIEQLAEKEPSKEADCDGPYAAGPSVFRDCEGNGWYRCRECARLLAEKSK